MASEQLNDQLAAIPGVASAEVTLPDDDGPPVARVVLDGSRDPEEVRSRINALLGASLPPVPEAIPVVGRRRSGLGRGLGEVIEEQGADREPAHLRPATEPVTADIVSVGVVETTDGVHVEVEDDAGNRRTHLVDASGSIDDAIIGAVEALLGIGHYVTITIADASTPEGDVVLATAVTATGTRTVGAAYVEFGRPWAVARAICRSLG